MQLQLVVMQKNNDEFHIAMIIIRRSLLAGVSSSLYVLTDVAAILPT